MTRSETAPPARRTGLDGDAGCSRCSHDRKAPAPRNPVTKAYAWYLRTVWRQPPACPHLFASSETDSGWDEPCGCTDPWHVAGT